MCCLISGPQKNESQVSFHPALNAPLSLRWLKGLQINISTTFTRVLSVLLFECSAPRPHKNPLKTPVFYRLSVSPGAPQSAQTSFPGICWIFLRDRAAVSLSDISVRVFASLAESEMFGWLHRAAARVKACSTWLCSVGKSAQAPALSPGAGATQTRVPSLTVRVMVGADLLVAPGPDSRHRGLKRRRSPLKEVKRCGCPRSHFPYYSHCLSL